MTSTERLPTDHQIAVKVAPDASDGSKQRQSAKKNLCVRGETGMRNARF